MIDLLDEYIAALPPDDSRPSGEQVVNSLKELEETERQIRDGKHNPYYGVLIAVT